MSKDSSEKGKRSSNSVRNVRFPLKTKLLVYMLVLMVIIGGASIAFGYRIFKSTFEIEYMEATWNLANAEAVLVNDQKTREKLDELLDVYAGLSEKEREEGRFGKYTALYEPCMDESFQDIRKKLRTMQKKSDSQNAYIAAIDPGNNRMINLIDSDPNPKTFYPPGRWDPYDPEEIDMLINGILPDPAGEAEREYRMQVILDTDWESKLQPGEERGAWEPRYTAGSTLYERDGYVVMAMMDNKVSAVAKDTRVYLIWYVAVLVIISIAGAVIVRIFLRRGVINPINRLTKAAQSYSESRQSPGSDLKHFAGVEIHTGDEIENLSEIMKNMESDMEKYERNLTRATAEKERINTELNLAARIQESMLPSRFPLFPERDEFDIYASMTPAKEVGGDFYDFFFTDDDHLVLTIADVAGKGVPASLFMMASDIMINDHVRIGEGSLAETLESVNEQMCNRNLLEMFVTVWIGVLEISTGKLRAANAGHEYPMIRRPGGEFEILKDKHGFVLGGMEGVPFHEYEIEMEPGSSIFVYTDGVPEATDGEQQMFGTERTLQALNEEPGGSPEELLRRVQQAVAGFVGDAEQFDDMTMLCLRYRPETDAGRGESRKR